MCADPTAQATGCVPINVFGASSITPAAAAYVTAETNHSFKVTQQVVDANLSGPLVDLPAGPLGLAIGAEYRKEKSAENWDALTNLGANLGNAVPDTKGSFNVKEAYAEVNVPILKDLPFANQLDLRAAGRISDYSTVGSVKTWNVGGDSGSDPGHPLPRHLCKGGPRAEHRRTVHGADARPSRPASSIPARASG